MNLHFHWINLLILFGAVQALIFSIILLFNKTHPGSKFLSLFIFTLAYNGFETFNWSSGLDQYYLFFDMFGFVIIYAIGPSLFLYVSSLLNPGQKFSKKVIAAHYGLVVFQFVSRITIISYHLLWINKIIKSTVSPNDFMNIIWFYAEPLSVLMFVSYLAATIYKFIMFTKTGQVIPSLYPAAQQIVIRWIKTLLICLTIFAVIWVGTVILPYFFKIPFSPYYPVELVLVLFIYWMVLNGYHKMKLIYLPNSRPKSFVHHIPDTTGFRPNISFPDPLKKSPQDSKPAPGVFPEGSNEIVADSGSYSNLSKVQDPIPDPDKYFRLLVEAMEPGKLYLDPDLNLTKLSAHTGIPAKLISAILNQYHDTNFNDFINSYRVTQVSLLMMDPTTRNLTISGLAMDAGFNSQATFQRAFKKHTGMSPRQFIARNLKKSA
jgi:AraC-like DNA-binding protein